MLTLATAQAVILFRTGDPTENTTPPTGADTNSGWQYEGEWGSFLGTRIAPHFFISAAHIGHAGAVFTFQSIDYHVVGQNYDPQSDFVIWEVAEEFPTFAPLYSRTDEVGQRIIEIGRGTQRGAAITLNDTLKGWLWGPGDGVVRWGENIVSGVYVNGPNDDLLMANFDQSGLPNECHLSSGDSGGAAFIEDAGVWKLAGINYAVDGPFAADSTGANPFNAAFFDLNGFYEQDGSNFVPVTGPSALYPTRISTKLPWIGAKIAQPRAGFEANSATITYTKLTIPTTDLTYVVQQSIDGISWENASATDEVLSTNGSTQRVKSTISIGSNTHLLLRVQLQRP
ncbi:MAG: hypothetical protein ACXV8A_07180 [Chthoniobacterales bacterium]